MMDKNWSYTKLVKEYGEDIAILLLEFMEGFGEFEPNVAMMEDRRDTPYDAIHDEFPLSNRDHYRITEISIDVGVDITLWRGMSVGERLWRKRTNI